MEKKYIAKSHVSLTLSMPNGAHRHISFMPQMMGGSTFATDDEAVQTALEKHPKYGKLFRADAQKKKVVKKAEKKIKEIPVTDAESAKDYLCDVCGVSRTKVKTLADIKKVAEQKGILFTGL